MLMVLTVPLWVAVLAFAVGVVFGVSAIGLLMAAKGN
jgi:hypothetical protein